MRAEHTPRSEHARLIGAALAQQQQQQQKKFERLLRIVRLNISSTIPAGKSEGVLCRV